MVVREDTQVPRNSKYLLLFLILAFSFVYRVILMLWTGFPPGADIGLHDSVIHSIMPAGNTDFLYNNYQMGGGLSLTFPGYHILVSQVILLTGVSDYMAQTFVVALFSTLIVACAFLITRKLWSESAAFIAAFLVAVSRFDIEMLMWGGYPNVLASMLIPLIVYMFLQSKRFSLWTFVATSSLLSAALFITHSLSSLVFDGIVLIVVIFALSLSKKLEITRKRILLLLVPVFLGTVIASPYLLGAIPAYLANAQSTNAVADIRLALMSTKIVPWELLVPLAACVVLFFLYSKEYKGRFLTISSLILTLWILVPLAFTQGYFVGFYTDYNRFLYYPLLPVFILIAVVIDHGATFLSKVAHVYVNFTKKEWQANIIGHRLWSYFTRKNLYAMITVILVLFSFFAVAFFMTPWAGTTVQGFYQVMNTPGYDAIQWAQKNIPTNSVFVSDAYYGWWFGGFAQRPTLSAVEPEYLSLSREFAPAQTALNLMDTDYVLGNGLIQIREDGGYTARHNPMFLANLNWSYFPYAFFNFRNDETTIVLTENGNVQSFRLSELQVTDMYVENASDWASIHVSKDNSLFSYTQIITIYEYTQFVNMSMALKPNSNDVILNGAVFTLQTKGESIGGSQTIGFYDSGGKVLGQLIFTKGQPDFHQSGATLIYSFSNNTTTELELWASAFSVSNTLTTLKDSKTEKTLNELMMKNLDGYQKEVDDKTKETLPKTLYVFDYKEALTERDISYVAVRDPEIISKFVNDPAYDLLFINNEVKIFKVK